MPPVDFSTIQKTQITIMTLSRLVNNKEFSKFVFVFMLLYGYSVIIECKIKDRDYLCLIH